MFKKVTLFVATLVCAMSATAFSASAHHWRYWRHHHRHYYQLPSITYLPVFSPDNPYTYYSPYTIVAGVLVHQSTLIPPTPK